MASCYCKDWDQSEFDRCTTLSCAPLLSMTGISPSQCRNIDNKTDCEEYTFMAKTFEGEQKCSNLCAWYKTPFPMPIVEPN